MSAGYRNLSRLGDSADGGGPTLTDGLAKVVRSVGRRLPRRAGCVEMKSVAINACTRPIRRTVRFATRPVLFFVRGLDKIRDLWYVDTMKPISEPLKKVIRASGLSDRNLGIQTGVNRQSIGRFVSGQTSLTLEQAERLAEFFGLELRPVVKKRSK